MASVDTSLQIIFPDLHDRDRIPIYYLLYAIERETTKWTSGQEVLSIEEED